ncbi:MAG: hypothetical protein AB1347_01245 [Acidobacteriota bacterium]
MELRLETEEASLLLQVIRNRVEELRLEVRHCRDSEDRAYLKHKERLLNAILAKFPEVAEGAYRRGFIRARV